MSQELKNSGSTGTTSDVSRYSEEIENLIGGIKPPTLLSTNGSLKIPQFLLWKNI